MVLAADVSWLQAIFIGVVEGLTEFLPVSSTAHMAVLPQLMGQPDPGAAFSAVVQMGPIIAIVAYFRHDLIRYVRGILRTKTPFKIPADDMDARLGWYTALGTLPALLMGYLLRHQITGSFRSLYVIAATFIIFGIVLFIAEQVGKHARSLAQMTWKDSQAIGWAQTLALIPGTSRSGATLIAGLFLGLDRESATRFSFLLSVPVITAAGLFEFKSDVMPVLKQQGTAILGPYLIGTLVAGIVAYAVIHWFLGYVRKHNTNLFIVYRIAFGVLLLVLLRTGHLKDSTETAKEARALHQQKHAQIYQGKESLHPALIAEQIVQRDSR